MTWGDALKICKGDSSANSRYNLASVHSQVENSFLITLISQSQSQNEDNNDYWLGGRYHSDMYEFIWSDYSEWDINFIDEHVHWVSSNSVSIPRFPNLECWDFC